MENRSYTIKKAAKFLSTELKLEIKLNRFNVMQMAARGEFNLCVPFDGNVAEFKYNHPIPVRAGVILVKLKALIKIPTNAINLRGGIVHIISIEAPEVDHSHDYRVAIPYYGSGCGQLPRLAPGRFWGTYTSDPENAGKIKFVAFEVDSNDAVIAEQDLLDFIKRNKELEQSDAQNTNQNTSTDWRANARQIGSKIAKEKPNYNVDKIAVETHAEMILRNNNGEKGMTGRGHKSPSAETIKRHALTGIKS